MPGEEKKMLPQYDDPTEDEVCLCFEISYFNLQLQNFL